MYAATNLPYPLPNPRPCGCQGVPAHAYGETEPEKPENGLGSVAKFALGAATLVGMFVLMSVIVPPAKEKPTIFLAPPPRKPYLPE